LWFPTIRGIVAVEPKIKTNDKPPPVIIEKVIVGGKSVSGTVSERESGSFPLTRSPAGPLTIPPGRGQMEIQYTALSLQAPEKNRFKYMLEGIDADWVNAGDSRTAHYNNIAPGSYRFRVIACNNDGLWNETGATLALVFLPHYWQTWSFKLVILGTIALLLTAFYRSRVRRLREIESLRVQIAADLHDDVGSRLTKVAMVTESLARETSATDRTKPHIENISKTTREIIQAMDEIVWTINPKNDTLDHLANYILQYAQEYFQNTGVRCRLDLPARLPERPLSTAERHNLFMAVKEALNNILKHAGATEVRIGLALADGKLAITIADNGCGFRPDQARSSGNGLANMKQRLERIGGQLVLETQPGVGTRIKMEAGGN
jgi:signal transduction histidine kinase